MNKLIQGENQKSYGIMTDHNWTLVKRRQKLIQEIITTFLCYLQVYRNKKFELNFEIEKTIFVFYNNP